MNRIVKHIGFVGLIVMAITVGVNAQSSQQYRADIPFSFDANGKHYAAGEYMVGPLSQVSVPGAIALRNLRNGNGHILGVNSTQVANARDDKGKLTFVKERGRYTLKQIATATFKMNMKVDKTEAGELAEIVAIDLKK